VCEREIERKLEAAPLVDLPGGADDRIIAAIEAAQPSRQLSWWQRGVPLWQAAAACLALCAVTFVAAWMLIQNNTTDEPIDSIVAPQPAPVTTGGLAGDLDDEPPVWRSDTSKWRLIQPANQEGSM
jgi:hypothetical protein